jgi:PmbA protein
LTTALEDGNELDLIDPALSDLNRQSRFDLALEIEKSAFATDPRVRSSRYVSFEENRSEVFLANTRGFEGGYEEANVQLSAMFGAAGRRGGQQLYGFQSSRKLSSLAPAALGASVAHRLAVTLDGVPVDTGRKDIVIDSSQTPYLLAYLGEALDGSKVHLGRSILRDRVGDRVGSALLDVVDDPEAEAEKGSAPWDDEGVRGKRKHLIESGILRGFLYDIGSASRAGTVSTGNGSRPDPGRPPQVGPTNLRITEGEGSWGDLVEDVEEGIYVTGFMGRGVDPISGRVSAAVLGARIAGGKLGRAVSGITLCGDLLDLLSSIDGIGSDSSRLGNLRAPTIRIRNALVAGENGLE